MEDQDTGLPARLQTAGGGYEEGSYRGVEWSGCLVGQLDYHISMSREHRNVA